MMESEFFKVTSKLKATENVIKIDEPERHNGDGIFLQKNAEDLEG